MSGRLKKNCVKRKSSIAVADTALVEHFLRKRQVVRSEASWELVRSNKMIGQRYQEGGWCGTDVDARPFFEVIDSDKDEVDAGGKVSSDVGADLLSTYRKRAYAGNSR